VRTTFLTLIIGLILGLATSCGPSSADAQSSGRDFKSIVLKFTSEDGFSRSVKLTVGSGSTVPVDFDIKLNDRKVRYSGKCTVENSSNTSATARLKLIATAKNVTVGAVNTIITASKIKDGVINMGNGMYLHATLQ